MIFVTLGTENYGFRRLTQELRSTAEQLGIVDQLFLQGKGTEEFDWVRSRDVIPRDEWLVLLRRADVVITHGGPGCVVAALEAGKMPVVVPRQARFGEHVDDHQVAFARFFERRGLIRAVFEIEDLRTELEQAFDGVQTTPQLPWRKGQVDPGLLLEELVKHVGLSY